MTAKERLIDELAKVLSPEDPEIPDFAKPNMKRLADWVEKDRARIVAPLVSHKKKLGYDAYDWKHKVLVRTECIDEAIKLSGV